MKYNLAKILDLNEPADGLSDLEKKLQEAIQENTATTLYAKLPTARMKFIVAAHFELGYSQELISEILGIKQPTLNEEIELIKMVVLGYKYKPRKFKDGIKPEELLQIIFSLVPYNTKTK